VTSGDSPYHEGAGLSPKEGSQQAMAPDQHTDEPTGVQGAASFLSDHTPQTQKTGPEVEAVGRTPLLRTVLLVDDDPRFLELIRKILEKDGLHVQCARDGIEAVAVFTVAYKEIDLVISDIGLPRLDGGTAMKLMRGINPAVRVMLVSGHLDEEKRILMINAGADECISKPNQPEDILVHVRRFLHPGPGARPAAK
jgi:CheY-like chemotaxis protein